MAVSLVGTGTFIASTNNGVSRTLTFSTGGAAANDIVVAWWVHTRGSLTANLRSSSSSPYTQLEATVNGNLGTLCAYRILTSAETTVTSCATGSAQDAVILAAIVLRGCDGTPIIVDGSTTGASSQPRSPAVVVGGPNDAVVTLAGVLANTTLTAPSGFGSAVSTGATDTRSAAGGLAYLSTNGGTYTPAAWASGSTAVWVANTVTLRSTEPLPFTWSDYGPLSTPPGHLIEPGLSAAWMQYHTGFLVPAPTPTPFTTWTSHDDYPSLIRGRTEVIGY